MHPVDTILDKYKEDVLPHLSEATQQDYARHLTVLSRLFGKRAAESITYKELREYLNQAPGGKGHAHRTKSLWCLRAAFNYAVQLQWLQSNVVKEVELRNPKPRDRIVTEQEFQRLKALGKHEKTMLAAELTWCTGLPQREILNLTWAQIYPDEEVIRQYNRRTGQSIDVKITPRVKALLDRCRQLPIESKVRTYVLPSKNGKRYSGPGFRARVGSATLRLTKTRATLDSASKISRIPIGIIKRGLPKP